MSKFCGKCDLYDHMMMERMYPQYPNNEHSPMISDELECFEIFKKRTGGKLYQHFKLKLSLLNVDKEISLCNNPQIFSKVEHKEIKKDKRYASGEKESIWYSYIYWGKEYKSLEELNKKHYYATRVIKFDTLFDLIPYFPYIIASCASDEDSEKIFISTNSYVDDLEIRHRQCGTSVEDCDSYRKELQKHYIDVVNKYGINDEIC